MEKDCINLAIAKGKIRNNKDNDFQSIISSDKIKIFKKFLGKKGNLIFIYFYKYFL